MKTKKTLFTAAGAVCLAASVAVTGFAATEHWNDNSGKTAISKEWKNWKEKWETIKNDYEKISLSPGADSTKMNYAWYSKTPDQAKIRISNTPDMTTTTGQSESNTYQENVTEFTGTSEKYKDIDEVSYYANKVTVTGLKENTTYYYQYFLNGEWSEVSHFTTGDTKSFSVMYVGDPQIGSSKGQTPSESESAQTAEIAARNDSFSWNKTLTAATKEHPEIDFMISAGDQINNTKEDNPQELEYAGFLSPRAMSSLPIAPTIGNHDSLFANFQNHFNVPNPDTGEEGATAAGYDYFYSYGDVLFITLDTNNYNVASHEKLLQKAIASHKDAKWKIVTFHQDIYGSGKDHSDSDGIILRTQLTTLFDKYDIDVVLQGHDHTYSRTYMLTSDGKEHKSYGSDALQNADDTAKAEFQKENLCYKIVDKTQGTVTNPDGVLYMEANSSTGSKFYNLIPTQQDYIAARSQTWTPTYSVIDFNGDSLTINTYDVNTGKTIDKSFTIKKTEETTPTTIAVKKVTLNKTKLTLKKGKTAVLQASVTPKNATNKKVTYTSSNKTVATVFQNGKVTGKKAGTATITAKCGSKKATCKVTVK